MNARGCYGAPIDGYRDAPLVGIVHTPQDTEDEMNQLHNEIMQFGGEAQGQIEAATNLIKDEPGYKELLAKVKAAEAHSQSLREKYKGKGGEMHERVAKHLGFSPPDISAQWIRDYFRVRDPDLAKELDERLAAVKIWREREAELAAYFNRRAKSSSILAWDANIWDPFRQEWIFWRGDHLRPAQLWPGSGAWDRIQDYRAKYIDIRNKAPFKAAGPSPIQPEERRDPSLLGGLSEFGSGLKWVVLGVLGVGGVLVASSIASNLRKGRRS